MTPAPTPQALTPPVPPQPIDDDLARHIATLVQAADDPAVPISATGKTLFTPDVVTRVLTAIRIGYDTEDACVYAGLSKKTYQEWCRHGRAGKWPYDLFVAVLDRVATTEASPIIQCFKGGAMTDPKTAERYLRVHPSTRDKWGPKQESQSESVQIVLGIGFGTTQNESLTLTGHVGDAES